MFFLTRRLTDVEEKVSTYLSIICIEDKKKDKNYKFRNNDILNHNIFSSTILVIKHFSPFISDRLLQTSKFCTNFDLLEFGKLRRCSSTI